MAVSRGFIHWRIVVDVKNFSYRLEFATNSVMQFAVGVDSEGEPLLQNDGHLHGWVFRLDRRGQIIREDSGRPAPVSYARFYGAGAGRYNSETGYFEFKVVNDA